MVSRLQMRGVGTQRICEVDFLSCRQMIEFEIYVALSVDMVFSLINLYTAGKCRYKKYNFSNQKEVQNGKKYWKMLEIGV